jgi:CDP-diacylglycerol---serine O-phosphatidyltransferase
MRARRKIDLRKTLFVLPNLITLSSIFCGFDAIRRAGTAKGDDDYYLSALLIVFAMIFDMLDGRVARMTKTQSAFGLQIDSLADVVSFGAAPALLVHQWTLHRFGTLGLVASFAFVACGAIRLARFNVLSMGEDGKPSKPSKYIVGLPIPGAAGILVAIVITSHAAGGIFGRPEWAGALLGITMFLSFLMVSTIRFRSFKDIKLNARTGLLVGFLVGSSVLVSTQLKPAFVLIWILGVYVLLGIFETLWQLPGRVRSALRGEAPADAAAAPARNDRSSMP